MRFAAILYTLTLAVPLASAQARPLGKNAGVAPDHSSQPATPLPILEHAQQLISQGNLPTAREELLKGLEIFPHEPAFLNFLGVVDAEENHREAAEKEFQKAIRAAPRYSGAYLNLAHLYQAETGQESAARAQAMETYRKLLEFEPRNAEANYQYAVLAMQQGAFLDSLGHLLKLTPQDLEKSPALAVLCADHAGIGERQKAAAAAHRLIVNPELTQSDVLSIVPALEAQHHVSLTIQLLEGLEQRNLASAQNLEQLGALCEQKGRLGEARHALEGAAREEPNAVRPLVELARVAYRQQDDRGALGYLAHARALEPQNAGIHFFFGILCVALDLHQEAYDSFKKAVQFDPNNPYYNYALGAVCTQREDAHEAIGYFRKYCALKPRDPRGKLALGAAYYYSHDLDSARAILLKALDDQATTAAANYYLGRIAKDEGKEPEAVQYLKRAIQDHPQYADACAALGGVYLNQKNFAEAQEALLHALRLEPDNYLANLNLTILYERVRDPRAAAQARRFAEVKKEREHRAKLFLRTIRVVP